jgi:LPXTG-motif cell wall-anchored protein
MKKLTKQQWYMVAGGVVAISLITFIVIRRRKNKKTIKQINDILDSKVKDPNAASEGQTIISEVQRAKLPDGRFPLKFASVSKKVYDLQKLLNKKYALNIDLDGKFGQSTASALCKNYFSTCFTDVQSRLYEVTEDDFKKLSTSANFDGDNFDGTTIDNTTLDGEKIAMDI